LFFKDYINRCLTPLIPNEEEENSCASSAKLSKDNLKRLLTEANVSKFKKFKSSHHILPEMWSDETISPNSYVSSISSKSSEDNFEKWEIQSDRWQHDNDLMYFPSDDLMSFSSTETEFSHSEDDVSWASSKRTDDFPLIQNKEILDTWNKLEPSFSVISHEQHFQQFAGKPKHPNGLEFVILGPNSKLWQQIHYDPRKMRDRWDAVVKWLKKVFKSKETIMQIRKFVRGRVLVYHSGVRLSYAHCMIAIAKGASTQKQVIDSLKRRFGFEMGNFVRIAEACIPHKGDIQQKFYMTAIAAEKEVRKYIPDLDELIELPPILLKEYNRVVPPIISECGKGCLNQPKLHKFLTCVSPNLDPEQYLNEFLKTESPFAKLPELDTDIFKALFLSVLQPKIVKAERLRRELLFKRIAEIVEPFYKSLKLLRPKSVEHLGSAHNPLLMQIALRALKFPDLTLPWEVYWGMKISGVIQNCSSLKRNYEKEIDKTVVSLDKGSWAFIRRHKKRLLNKPFQDSSLDTDDHHEGGDDILVSKTLIELDRGEAVGPYSLREMLLFWRRGTFRPMLRFVTWSAAKYREIDSGRASGHNENTILMNRISCSSIESVDVVSVVQKRFWDSVSPDLRNPQYRLLGGTEDLKRAYRQVAVCPEDLRWNCTMYPWYGDIRFSIVLGLVFGLAASVVGFNRVSLFLEFVMRMFLLLVVLHYYDDFSFMEFFETSQQVQDLLYVVTSLLGFFLDRGKSQGPTGIWKWLGAMKAFDWLGVTTFMHQDRKEKIRKMINKFLNTDWLSPSEAATLRGKYQFLSLGMTGKSGRIALRALITRQYYEGTNYRLDEPLRRNLVWMKLLMTVLPPARVNFSSLYTQRRTLHLFTDASSEEIRDPKYAAYKQWLKEQGAAFGRHCRLGWLGWEKGVLLHKGFADIDEEWLLLWERVQPIAQAESLGVLMALMEIIRDDRNIDVILGCDNQVVVHSLISGNSRNNCLDDIISSINIFMSSRGCRLWVEWTPTKNNPADGPSRDGFHAGELVPRRYVPSALMDNLPLLIMGSFNEFSVSTLLPR